MNPIRIVLVLVARLLMSTAAYNASMVKPHEMKLILVLFNERLCIKCQDQQRLVDKKQFLLPW